MQGAKVRTSISTFCIGMQQQNATPTTTTTDQLKISTGAGAVHDAAIIANCVSSAPTALVNKILLSCKNCLVNKV